MTLQVIPAFQAMIVGVKTENPRKEPRNTKQNQRQQKNTNNIPIFLINYAEQQRITD